VVAGTACFDRLVPSDTGAVANSAPRQISGFVQVLFSYSSCGTWECRATGRRTPAGVQGCAPGVTLLPDRVKRGRDDHAGVGSGAWSPRRADRAALLRRQARLQRTRWLAAESSSWVLLERRPHRFSRPRVSPSQMKTRIRSVVLDRVETASRSDLLWDRDSCAAEGSACMSANTTPSPANVPIASRTER
jgi:hypothetical protein